MAKRNTEKHYIKCSSCGKKQLIQTHHPDGTYASVDGASVPRVPLAYTGGNIPNESDESITYRVCKASELHGKEMDDTVFTHYTYPPDAVERFVAEHMASGCKNLILE